MSMRVGNGFRVVSACVAVLVSGTSACAENIEGTIAVRRPLTKLRVTGTLPPYQRGTAVALLSDRPEDPLAFERSRVVVYLEGHKSGSLPEVTAMIEQENRRFRQDTVVIPVGSRVSFPNRDSIFHNVFSLSRTRIFDLGNYAKGETRSLVFNEPGVVFVNCHLHPNMVASIVVTPNQWNAKVDPDGHFILRDVPPGQYTIVAWHKATGVVRTRIVVTPGQDSRIEILVPLEADSSRSAPARGPLGTLAGE